MGTRNLTAVMLDGEYKIAQYGQWDGYPSGQGQTVLKFLHSLRRPVMEQPEVVQSLLKEFGEIRGMEIAEGLDAESLFQSRVRALEEISEDELQALWEEFGVPRGSAWIGWETAKRFAKKYPWLYRDAGAEVLNHVLLGEANKVRLEPEFAQDSLFCEWAYVIDLDKRTFEVYRGFNQQPLSPGDRFYKEPTQLTAAEQDRNERRKDDMYYGVRLRKSYSLDDLPTQEQMELDCEDPPSPEDGE